MPKNYIYILVALLISIFIILYSLNLTPKSNQEETAKYIEGKQIIEVNVNMYGYSPKIIHASSNTETIIKLISTNSYGCERSFTIPSKKIQKILPSNGVTEINLGSLVKDTKILATCSMGMYSFQIIFDN